jgi:hypothetical protein
MRREDDAFGIVRDDAVEILRVPSFNPQGCKFAAFLGSQRTTETASFRAADSETQLIFDEDLGSKTYASLEKRCAKSSASRCALYVSPAKANARATLYIIFLPFEEPIAIAANCCASAAFPKGASRSASSA